MAHDQGVRRLVLLVMISSPVTSWSSARLAKILRIRSSCVRFALNDLLDKGWIYRMRDSRKFWSFIGPSQYCVAPQGFGDGLVDLIGHRLTSRKNRNSPKLSPGSLTGLLPIANADMFQRADPSLSRNIHAPSMFELCKVLDGNSTETLAWGMHFAYCVVLTGPSGAPLGRFPDPHSARRGLARTLGMNHDAIYLLWIPPRRPSEAKSSAPARNTQLSRAR